MKKAYSKPDLEVLLLETGEVVMVDWGTTSETDLFDSEDPLAMGDEEGPGLE